MANLVGFYIVLVIYSGFRYGLSICVNNMCLEVKWQDPTVPTLLQVHDLNVNGLVSWTNKLGLQDFASR